MLLVLTGQLTFGSLDDACTEGTSIAPASYQTAH